jgi:Zn-finger nucleic acid-binding protein
MRCPRDGRDLTATTAEHATTYVCAACSGRVVTVALLRRMMPAERLHELWTLVRGGAPGEDPCPSCARTMHSVEFSDGDADLRLDGCPSCQVVWFGADALRALAPNAASPAPVLDAPVPADASDQWIWRRFFQVLNEKHGGIAGMGADPFTLLLP